MPKATYDQLKDANEFAGGKYGWFVPDFVRKAVRDTRAELYELRSKVQTLTPLETKNAQLVTDNALLVEANATLREKVTKGEEDNTKLTVELCGAEQAVSYREVKLADALRTIEDLRAQLAAEQASLRGAGLAITKLENEKAGLETELDKCRNSYGKVVTDLTDSRGKVRELETKLTAAVTEKLRAEKERDGMRTSLKGALDDLKRAETLADERFRTLNTIREALGDVF